MRKPILFLIITLSLSILFFIVFTSLCSKKNSFIYKGKIKLEEHKWLSNKKILIDPGHGGSNGKDNFRVGPEGLTEEEINLNVSLLLFDMLKKSGAEVYLTRDSNKKISLIDRVKIAENINPDLLISIHHNGTMLLNDRDTINYPTVFFWGNKQNRPLNFQFAKCIIVELNKIIPTKGKILSDYSIFKESGARILRETRYICPGILTEGGFFTHPEQELKFKNTDYNQLQAEALFRGISDFLRKGLPRIKVYISEKPFEKKGVRNIVSGNKMKIAIKFLTGINDKSIQKNSLQITVDNLQVKTKKIDNDLYLLNFEKKYYAGSHKLRIQYRNSLNQSSMIYSSSFNIIPKKGILRKNIQRGITLIKENKNPNLGLKLLIPALNATITDPDSDKVVFNIALGFKNIGDKASSNYYFLKLYNFFPESKYIKLIPKSIITDYRFPVDYYGKYIAPIYYPDIFKKDQI